MKIAYVTYFNSSDVHSWSGTVNFMQRSLESAGFQVEVIHDLSRIYQYSSRLKRFLYKRVLRKKYHLERAPKTLKSYASQVEKALAHSNCELIFSVLPAPITYLNTDKPIVYVNDATFAGLVDFYPEFSNLSAESIRDGNKMEQLALTKSKLAIFSSKWAAKTALENYDVDPNKVKVVPFGANINSDRKMKDIYRIVKKRDRKIIKLLFLGVDWYRKGGDTALKVAELLNNRGFKTDLHIVGCMPPAKVPNYVKLHGFVSKRTAKGEKKMRELFTHSHFLILPSQADCVPMVFAEASSFGLPSLATNVGGIPTAIRNGKNGQTFSLNDGPDRYCDYIIKTMSDRKRHEKLCFASFREYSERLNWSAFGKQVHTLIRNSVDK